MNEDFKEEIVQISTLVPKSWKEMLYREHPGNMSFLLRKIIADYLGIKYKNSSKTTKNSLGYI